MVYEAGVAMAAITVITLELYFVINRIGFRSDLAECTLVYILCIYKLSCYTGVTPFKVHWNNRVKNTLIGASPALTYCLGCFHYVSS